MKRLTIALNLLVSFTLTQTTIGKEILREINWKELADSGQIPGGQVITSNDNPPLDMLKVENDQAQEKTVTILSIDNPGISTCTYAISGQMRYENVEGIAWLEMWSRSPDGSRYYSKTFAESGPLKKVQGSSSWRHLTLPFYINEKKQIKPDRILVNVVMPGQGTIYLSNLQLIQYIPGEDPLAVAGQWWNDRTGGLLGAILGVTVGLMGALTGILCSMGRARTFVITIMKVMLITGLAASASGIAALALSQPYGVYYPLLLIGIICSVVSYFLTPTIRKRYQEHELRKISAADVS